MLGVEGEDARIDNRYVMAGGAPSADLSLSHG